VLSRLAGLDWEVRRTPYERLREADVGARLGFKRARIPTLREVLTSLPGHFLINIELKCERVDDDALSEKTAALVKELGLSDRVVISSFNPLCLFRMAHAFPELRRGLLLSPDGHWKLAASIVHPLVSSHSLHPFEGMCTPERTKRWMEAGFRLAVWTVDDGARARELKELGVTYLITNRPGQVRRALQ
jgi:glycerophosphoryl diester phosphodiesterase